MRPKQRTFPTASALVGLFLMVACSDSSTGPNSTGGQTSATGGTPATGGVSATGGSASGGKTTGGGVAGSGGQVVKGGTPATGGSGGAGGAGGKTSGGAVASGGASGSGGAAGTSAGGTATGGRGATGGATGGTTTGGTATGGTATGGTTTGGTTTGGTATGGTATGGSATGGSSATGGGGSGGASATGGTVSTGGAGGAVACDVAKTIQWSTGAPIISPVGDSSHNLSAVKDPTVVRYNGSWHVFGSTVTAAGAYSMFYVSFANWTDAPTTKLTFLDQTPKLNGYTAAPQVFYFTPQKKWYLVYQSGPPMYSTNTDISNAKGWTAPTGFYSSTPAIVAKDGWLDFWVICDAQNCHMFFSDDHGRWYRAKTSVASFPSGFGTPEIVMQDADAGRLFEASNVYKIDGTNKYLAIIEAYDSTSNWRRYFRSWTATSLDGPWTALHNDATAPFAGNKNVAFDGKAWTTDISHGDVIRSAPDETMPIDACHLQMLIQGYDPSANTTDYNKIPWNIGLLTAK